MINLTNFKVAPVDAKAKAYSKYRMSLSRNNLSFNKQIAKYFNVYNGKPAYLQFLFNKKAKQIVVLNYGQWQKNTYRINPIIKSQIMNIMWSKKSNQIRQSFQELSLPLDDELININANDIFEKITASSNLDTIQLNANYSNVSKDEVLEELQHHNTKQNLQLLISVNLLNNDFNWKINANRLFDLISKYPAQFKIIDAGKRKFLKLDLTPSGLKYIKHNFINFSQLKAIIALQSNNTLYFPANKVYPYLIPIGIIKKDKYADSVLDSTIALNQFDHNFPIKVNINKCNRMLYLRRNYHIYFKPDKATINDKSIKCLIADLTNEQALKTNLSMVDNNNLAMPIIDNKTSLIK